MRSQFSCNDYSLWFFDEFLVLFKQIFNLIVFIEDGTSFWGYSKTSNNLKDDNHNNFQIHFNIICLIYYYILAVIELMLQAIFSCLYTSYELSCAAISKLKNFFLERMQFYAISLWYDLWMESSSVGYSTSFSCRFIFQAISNFESRSIYGIYIW